jgi:hypothetical protein
MTGGRHISFWIAAGIQEAPRNDDHCHDYGNDYDKKENGIEGFCACRFAPRRMTGRVVALFLKKG